MVRGLLSASPPQRVAPRSLIQVIGWAVTSESSSNRTSGPCSAFRSLRDRDGLKFRPGKLTKRTTQCHPSALGVLGSQRSPVGSAYMAPLEEETKCGAIKTQSQRDGSGCSLLTISRVFLFYPPWGYGEQGEEGRAMPFLFCFVLFSLYLQVNSLLLLKVYCEQMCPFPHPHP